MNQHIFRYISRGVVLALALSIMSNCYAATNKAKPGKKTKEGLISAFPAEEDDALLFSAATVTKLTLKVSNPSKHDLRLVVAVRPFVGMPVKKRQIKQLRAQGKTVHAYGTRFFYRIDTPADQSVRKREVVIKTGSEGPMHFDLGKLPPGFYMLDITFFRDATKLSNNKYPLAVVDDIKPVKLARPIIPIGVYTRFMQYKRTTKPLFWKTYVHAIACDLRKHNLNAIVSCGGFRDGELDIYSSYGVAGISRGGNDLDHPGVIASLVGDEPRPGKKLEQHTKMYKDLATKTDKIFTTCMVGESMGFGDPAGPTNMWKLLKTRVRWRATIINRV